MTMMTEDVESASAPRVGAADDSDRLGDEICTLLRT